MNIKNDQKGFTIVELITSFSLTMVVLIFLFNIVILMKKSYVENSAKSDLISEQSLLVTSLNEDLNGNATSFELTSCDSGYEKCYRIVFSDGTNKKLSFSKNDNKIKYGNIIYTNDSFNTESLNICYYNDSSNGRILNSILSIDMKIYSKLIEKYNFGINVVLLYNKNTFTVSGVGKCS